MSQSTLTEHDRCAVLFAVAELLVIFAITFPTKQIQMIGYLTETKLTKFKTNWHCTGRQHWRSRFSIL